MHKPSLEATSQIPQAVSLDLFCLYIKLSRALASSVVYGCTGHECRLSVNTLSYCLIRYLATTTIKPPPMAMLCVALASLVGFTTAHQSEPQSYGGYHSSWGHEGGWGNGHGGYPTPCTRSSGHATAVPHYDVAVAGAGLSGLSAAENLIKGGRSVGVFEARDRVGGRVLNVHLKNGGVQEVGAEYVGPTQDRYVPTCVSYHHAALLRRAHAYTCRSVLALAASLGLKTYKTYNEGNDLYYNGTGTPYSSVGLPPIDNTGLSETINAAVELANMGGTLNVSAPWEAPSAKAWDSVTFASWLDSKNFSASARALLEVTLTSVWSVEPAEVSLLYIVSYIASAGNSTEPGNLLRLITTDGGAQDSRINGGTQLLAIKLADRIKSQKGHVQLSAPVRRISRANDSQLYELYSDDPVIPLCTAKEVVVAMSPPMASRIIYHPLLPAARDQLTQRMPMGAIGKAIAVYKRPFWRDAKLSGQVVSTDTKTTIRASFDNTPSDPTYGALMGFIEADEMRRLDAVSEEEVQSEILSDFVKYFGKEAASPTEFVLQRWDNEEFSRGAPVAYAPPGVLTRYGPALRKPAGGIHWAGTETSDYWVGYMDGAIRSGERVAKEILAS